MRSVTEVGDTLFEIAARLDDRALLALYPAQQEQITKLIANDRWWYVRSQFLVRRDLTPRSANWSRIYYALLDQIEHGQNRGRALFQSGLDYLPSYLVLEEVFGKPTWGTSNTRDMWSHISDPGVLQHLLDIKLLKKREARGITSIARHGWTSMVEPLYRLMKANINEDDLEEFYSKLGYVCSLAIEAGHYDTAEAIIALLVENDPDSLESARRQVLMAVLWSDIPRLVEMLLPLYGNDRNKLSQALEEAIWNSVRPDMIQSLVDMGLIDLQGLKERFDEALRDRRWNIISFLVDRGYVDSNLPWAEMLEETIRSGSHQRPDHRYVEYLITKTSAASEDNRLLRLAVGSDWYEIASSLLKDPRVDPMKNLRGILDSDPHTSSDETMRIENVVSLTQKRFTENLDIASILKDKRVRVELMDLPTLRLAIWWSEVKAEDKIEAVRRMGTSRGDLGRRIETWKTDSYGLLLAFILIKLPTGPDLLDWMIAQDNDDFQTVSTAILTNKPVPDRLLPIEALLLCILYPAVQFSEISSYVRTGSHAIKSVLDSEVLVALYLGLSGIRQREQAVRRR